MRLIDELKVASRRSESRIEFLQGDLSQIPPKHEVDVLVVSAFPNDYLPTATSLIGALHQKGLSVSDLALSKEIDLRSTCSCWLSSEITEFYPGLRFKRILCFEPAARGRPPEVVGDIFRALTPCVAEKEIRSVAIPLVAAGDQTYPVSLMLPPLIEAAHRWLSVGLPVEVIKIVSFSDRSAELGTKVFAAIKARHKSLTASTSHQSSLSNHAEHQVFLSYCHKDKVAADTILAELQKNKVTVFFDTLSIDIGAAWQQKIFDALDSCRRLVALYSPDYVHSKVCQEEFNIAWARGRDESANIIFPIYWASAKLPTYMRMLNYIDCRECNQQNLRTATSKLLATISQVA